MALPPLAGVLRHRETTSPRVWIMLWCILYLLANAVAEILVRHQLYNHPVTYFEVPAQGAVILWGLSLWQLTPTSRMTMRFLIPLLLVCWIPLVVLFEDIHAPSSVAEPVYCILALGAAAYTLVTRSLDETEPLLRQDWFWICVGMSIHFAAIAVLTPIARRYMETNVLLVTRAYQVRAVVNVLGFILITVGMLCPRPARSGLSS